MDWIHCNLCFIQPKTSNSKFVLTSCGHVFCELCENQEGENECKVCCKSCTTIPLQNNVIPQVKEYFEEPVELLEKILKAIKFQRGHGLNLLAGHKKYVEKYQKAKTHIQKMEQHYQKLLDEVKELEKKISYHEKHSSPANQFNFTPYTNETESPYFNTQNGQSDLLSSPQLFSKPNTNAFRRHRNQVHFATPGSESSSGTPTSFESPRLINQQNQLRRQNLPFRTPPYKAMNDLKINGSGSGSR